MNTFQPGQRIALVSTNDPYTQLRPGDTGTVLRHDQAHHTVYITWDNGSSLSMCLDAGDRIRPLPTPGSDQPAGRRVPAQRHRRGPVVQPDIRTNDPNAGPS